MKKSNEKLKYEMFKYKILQTAKNKRAKIILIDNKALEKLVKSKSAELIKTQLELERAKRLSDIGFLASTVAHEMRNPLAAITMAAANIKRKANNPELDTNLATIAKKIGESEQIINNLLFYTKLRPPKLEEVSIQHIILDAIENIEKQYPNKAKVITKLKTIKNILLYLDSLQLQEVFSNLLNNAFDAMDENVRGIEISARLGPSFISIYMKDSGSGITKADLERVFDPFFTTKAKGTGLGLTICNQIIKLHGGQLEIESKKNEGTTLIISLPRHN